jgi:hypothetical protein
MQNVFDNKRFQIRANLTHHLCANIIPTNATGANANEAMIENRIADALSTYLGNERNPEMNKPDGSQKEYSVARIENDEQRKRQEERSSIRRTRWRVRLHCTDRMPR